MNLPERSQLRSHKKIIKFGAVIIIVVGVIIISSFSIICSGIFSPNAEKNDTSSGKNDNSKKSLIRLKYAQKILDNIDDTVDPCDNFYDFACGKFKNSQRKNIFTKSTNNFYNWVRNDIDEIDNTTFRPFKLVKDLFDMCHNQCTTKILDDPTLAKILKKFGVWPVFKNTTWNESEFNWEDLVYDMQKIGLPTHFFMSLKIAPDIHNNSNSIIELVQPSWQLNSYSWDLEVLEIYNTSTHTTYEHMQNFFADNLNDPNINENQVQEMLIDLKKFQSEFIGLVSHYYNNLSKMDMTLMTIKDLGLHWPTIHWNTLIHKVLQPYINFTDDYIIGIRNTSYITAFEKLMKNTPKRVQKNFAITKIIEFSKPHMNCEIKDHNKYAHRSLYNCINNVMRYLPLSIHALYARKRVNKNDRTQIAEIAKNIKNKLINLMKTVPWLDEKTRIDAINKAKNIFTVIAYTGELLDDKILSEYYESLELNNSSFLQSVLNIRLFNKVKSYMELTKPRNRTNWRFLNKSFLVNAANFARSNIIIIYSGLLQDTLFNSHLPAYVNYATIGSIIGHEFYHSFDHEGILFDKDGNLRNWWTYYVKRMFYKRTKCIVDQYNNYTDGAFTLNENISDIGGNRVSYLAYKEWLAIHGSESALPKTPFTANQLYWISYANVWCTSKNVKYVKNPHAPDDVRIRLSLSNIPEFSHDFNCSLGSNMNPKNKCYLW